MTILYDGRNSARAFRWCRRGGRRAGLSHAWRRPGVLFGVVLLVAAPAHATFHFMQIELLVGGVDGNPRAQAIQLRARRPFQHEVRKARLVVRDAAGENPIELIDIDADVSNTAEGARILVVSADMAKYTDPPVAADFVMPNVIPESYLEAGSLTFENDEETLVVWRLSWGGGAYTGPTNGAFTNDDDGEFGPPFSGAVPTDGKQGVQFVGAASDLGSSNASDYGLTSGPAVLTNASDETFTVISIQCPEGIAGDEDSDGVCAGEDNCPAISNHDQIDFDSDGFGDTCDRCPGDPAKVEPGDCGCGVAEVDDDGDGVSDCLDDTGDPDHGMNDPPDGDGDPPDMQETTTGTALCGVGVLPLWPALLVAVFLFRCRSGRLPSMR